MPDLKKLLFSAVNKFAKTQTLRPEAIKRMEKVQEAAKEAAKIPIAVRR